MRTAWLRDLLLAFFPVQLAATEDPAASGRTLAPCDAARQCRAIKLGVGAGGAAATGWTDAHARAGATARARALPVDPGGAGASRSFVSERRRRKSRVSAAPRCTVADPSSDGQQHLRPAAAAIGDPRALRSGPSIFV